MSLTESALYLTFFTYLFQVFVFEKQFSFLIVIFNRNYPFAGDVAALPAVNKYGIKYFFFSLLCFGNNWWFDRMWIRDMGKFSYSLNMALSPSFLFNFGTSFTGLYHFSLLWF